MSCLATLCSVLLRHEQSFTCMEQVRVVAAVGVELQLLQHGANFRAQSHLHLPELLQALVPGVPDGPQLGTLPPRQPPCSLQTAYLPWAPGLAYASQWLFSSQSSPELFLVASQTSVFQCSCARSPAWLLEVL